MSSSIVLLSFAVTIFIHLVTARNQSQLQDCTGSAEYCWNCSAISGNYTANSAYERNLDSLLLSIYSSVDDQSNYLFYNASLGRDPDDVNAISLCRGGLALESCQKCLNDTSHMLLERCPNRKEAILWGERCMVRYSDSSIFSIEKNEPIRILPSPNEAADAEQFKEVLKPLLDDLISKAATDVNKYASNSAKVLNSEPIYALVQCTPDLSQKECSDCLQDSSLKIPDCCYGKNGARILKPSCNLRYESGPFYDDNGPEDNGICTQTAEFCWNCFDVSNDSGIAIFEENLKKLLSSFASNSTRNAYGFYNSSSEEGSNRVNAMALCRGDLSPEICQSCIYNSSERLLGRCPNRREAILWDEQCMVRYSNRTIFSVRQDDPRKYVSSPNEAWEPNLFMITLKPLLDNLISKAASGDSLRKYASGQSTVPGYETIYATAQCTPDLNEQQCSGCLQESTLFIPQQFGGKQGARILKPSCNLRYEVSQFFVPTADPPVSSLNSSKGKSKTKRTIIVASAVLTVIVVIIIISVCVFLKMMRKPGKKLENDNEISWAESLQFDFETIRAATDGFSDENKLGQGGFGAVYRGRLSNGHIIAVKRLSETSDQGDQEFKNEVMLVARLQHRNLVRLLGFCLDEKERLLVYEYVPNSSLDKFIFDPIKRTELDWDRRYKIVQGIVRGLLYLHEDSRFRIIHRDLKASNILLDDEMNPKISDFGMARLFVFDQTQGNTSRIVGTYGYMAPEYVLHGQFSVKSDIFSFGVLILEIVSGHKNSCIRNGEEVEDLLTYAWQNWREGTASNIIDPTLSVGSRAQIMRCIHVGLLCVQENVADRPTMNSIVLMFNSNSATLAVPSKPAFFMHSATRPEVPAASDANSGATQSDHSQNVSAQGSQNEVSISEEYPRYLCNTNFIFTSFISSIPIIPVAQVQPSNFLYQICSDKQGNYTANGTYQTNLHTLLSSLTSNDDINTGFYASNYGEIPDIVYATGLCRGDVKPDDCRSCLNDSRHLLTQLCPNQKEAIIWFSKCTLRYSNRHIFGIMERFPAFCMTNERNISSDRGTFNPELRALLENLRIRAASGDSSRKFAVGSANATNHLPNIYALVQCIPDLLDADCSDCIVRGVKILERYCNGSIWAYVGLSSCNVAYDLKLFYNSTTEMLIQLPPPPPPPPQMPPPSSPGNSPPPSTNATSAGKGKRNNTSQYVTIISLSSVVSFMVLLLCFSLYLRMRKAKVKMETNSSCQAEEGSYNNAEFSKFDFCIITDATDNFLDANKLGQGGFGAVYRGRLSNGKEIAVKRLKKDSGTTEFQNEVQLIAKLEHRNLVNLLGFCLEKHERILVYEFVPNSSLDRFLFDPIKREHLDWNTRYKIIIGITRGLLYLHEESRLKIIHRDLKAGNILLDAEMNPKIADFGTARLFALDQSEEITEKIVGTYGYMAPEYARHGSFSVKSDVFSFGVLVLEIVCGQKVNNFCDGEKPQSLLSYAWENWKKVKAMNLVDPKMRTASRHEILRCIHIGLLCVQEKRADRPTMRSVVLMLSSYSLALRSPSQPAYFVKLEREAYFADPSRYENTSAPIQKTIFQLLNYFPVNVLHIISTLIKFFSPLPAGSWEGEL